MATRGRNRDRDALAEPVAQGAVEPISPDAATWRPQLLGDPSQPRSQRAADHEDARNRDERELPARIGARTRVQGKGDRGREQQGIPARRRSRERHRRDARGTHHARALKRRPRARQRHVQRHEAEERDTPPPWPEPSRHEQRQRKCHQQHHVLPTHREQVREAGVAPVVARRAVDLLVLAQHHPERERRVRLRETGGHRRLGSATQAIEHTRDAAAPRAGEPDALDDQLAGDAAPAQMGGEVEARAGIIRGPAQMAAQRELVADRRAAGEPAPLAAVEAQQDTSARERAAGDAGLRRCAERRGPRVCEEMSADRDRSAVVDRGRRMVERIETGGACRATREEQGGRKDREPGRPGTRQAGEQGGGGRKAERGLGLRQGEPDGERADRDMPRPAGEEPAPSCLGLPPGAAQS